MRTTLFCLLLIIGIGSPLYAQIQVEEEPAPPDKKKDDKKKAGPDTTRPTKPLTAEQKDEFAYQVLKLGSSRWGEREKGTKKLIRMGRDIGPLIITELKKLAKSADDKAEVKFRLRKVLKAIGMAHLDPETFAELMGDKLAPLGNAIMVNWQTRYQEKPTVQYNAKGGLAPIIKMGATAVPGLLKMLRDERAAMRVNMAYVLGQMGSKEAGPALTKALSDKEAKVRLMAAYSLGVLKITSAAPKLVELAEKDTDKNVKTAAVLSLLPMKDRASIGLLIDLLPQGGVTGFNADWILKRATGHRTRYKAFREERRAEGVKQWRAWWAKNGKKFKWAWVEGSGPSRKRMSIGTGTRVIEIAPVRPVKAAVKKPAKKPVKKEEKKK